MEWKPVSKMPKSIKKGMMRIYSFEPSSAAQDGRKGYGLQRAYQFTPCMGHRVLDLYMDVPLPVQSIKE